MTTVRLGVGRGHGGALSCPLCGGPLHVNSRYGVCKRNPACKLEWTRRYSAARVRNRSAAVQADPFTFRITECLRGAKRRAAKLGLPFDLTIADLPPMPEFCPVLGIRLVPGGRRGTERNNSPSLDRLIPSLGYVTGNVQWISYRANMLRRDATAAELRLVAEYAERAETGQPRIIHTRQSGRT